MLPGSSFIARHLDRLDRLSEFLFGLVFLTGWQWARATHSNPWVFGTFFLLAGLGMVAIAMAFGG